MRSSPRSRRWIAAVCVITLAGFAMRSLDHERRLPVEPVRHVETQRLFQPPTDAIRIDSSWSSKLGLDEAARGLPAVDATAFDDAGDLDRWMPIQQAPGPAAGHTLRPGVTPPVPAPPAVDPRAAHEGAAGLRFPQPAGGLIQFFPIEPDTPYLFEAFVRRSVVPTSKSGDPTAQRRFDEDTLVGSVLLFELHELPDLDAHGGQVLAAFADSLEWMAKRHVLAPPGIADQFERRQLLFKSNVLTKGLVIALAAGVPGWWAWEDARTAAAAPPPGATVDFDAVRLTRIPLRRYLALQDQSASDDLQAAGGDPFFRPAKIIGDVRPACLAPPNTRIEIPLILPDGPLQLDLGYGMLEERQRGFGRRPVQVRALLRRSASTESLIEDVLLPAADPSDRGWQDHVLQLDGSGEPAALVLETIAEDCEEVVVFSEPRLTPLRRDAPAPPHVILISLDTLRPDHLGYQGYRRADGRSTSPHLDALADESLCFLEARSTAPYTLPSHASMMTGLYPQAHGVLQFGTGLNPEVHDLIAPIFAAAGYATSAFTAGGFLSYENGFHHGFDRYSILDPFLTAEDPFRENFPRNGDRAFNDAQFDRYDTAAVLEWISAHRDTPFFLFVHSYATHNYFPPADLARAFVRADPLGVVASDRDVKRFDKDAARRDEPPSRELLAVLEDLYDATVAHADQQVGRILDHLDALGLRERTVVAITSDHGEEFGEHGGLLHGRSVYEEMLRVPLLIRIPGVPPERVTEPVDLTDLAPTLLSAAGLRRLRHGHGLDLVSRLRRDRYQAIGYGEVDARSMTERYALYAPPYKLIWNPASALEEPVYEDRRPPTLELYDLHRDPAEQVDLLGSDRGRHLAPLLKRLLDLRLATLERDRRRFIPDERLLVPNRMSEELARALEALGYLDGEDGELAEEVPAEGPGEESGKGE